MAQTKSANLVEVYQFKVTLSGIKPPIWRRIQVKDNITLRKFHEILIETMDWLDYHLHEFDIGGQAFGPPDEYDPGRVRGEAIRLAKLGLRPKDKFLYLYDFGDSWEHLIELEATLPVEPKVKYPRCLAGKRAAPPEDCGGVWGYQELIELMANPAHEQYEEMHEWLGRDLDPEAFSPEVINERYRTMAARRRAAQEAYANDPFWGQLGGGGPGQ